MSCGRQRRSHGPAILDDADCWDAILLMRVRTRAELVGFAAFDTRRDGTGEMLLCAQIDSERLRPGALDRG